MFLNVKNPVSLQVQSTFLIQTKLLRGWREASCYVFFKKKKTAWETYFSDKQFS